MYKANEGEVLQAVVIMDELLYCGGIALARARTRTATGKNHARRKRGTYTAFIVVAVVMASRQLRISTHMLSD
jgi:hypothetical protein